MNFDFKRITLGNIGSMLTVLGCAFVLYADIQVVKNDVEWIKAMLVAKIKTTQTASLD